MKRIKKYADKGYQSAFFTSEQQTGSGQLNLLDQIERDAETKKLKS